MTMTRDDLRERIIEAIDRVHDMDVSHDDYAESVADALWSDLSPQWKPIETAPKDGTTILVCLPRIMNLIVRASYSTVHKYWKTDHETDGGITSPTFFHDGDLWQPLPEPPVTP